MTMDPTPSKIIVNPSDTTIIHKHENAAPRASITKGTPSAGGALEFEFDPSDMIEAEQLMNNALSILEQTQAGYAAVLEKFPLPLKASKEVKA